MLIPKATALKGDKIIVETELKIVKKEGNIETSILNISSAGTVESGKAKNQQTTAETGLILRSANSHRWKIQISDTGQLVTTDLGV